MESFVPDLVAPEGVREHDLVAIVLTAGDAHKLALSDAQVGMLVRQAITARLVNPPTARHARQVLTEQERSVRWVKLYNAMSDDLNPNAEPHGIRLPLKLGTERPEHLAHTPDCAPECLADNASRRPL